MKRRLQPLSERFVYGSPEQPSPGAYRWVAADKGPAGSRSKQQREVPHVGRHRH